jgi:hypothetical protein
VLRPGRDVRALWAVAVTAAGRARHGGQTVPLGVAAEVGDPLAAQQVREVALHPRVTSFLVASADL